MRQVPKLEVLISMLMYLDSSSCDAYNVTAPSSDGLGAQMSMCASLKDARLTPAQIDYINAHGTGTQLNDTAEAEAIQKTFKEHQPWVSSSKSQFDIVSVLPGQSSLLSAFHP